MGDIDSEMEHKSISELRKIEAELQGVIARRKAEAVKELAEAFETQAAEQEVALLDLVAELIDRNHIDLGAVDEALGARRRKQGRRPPSKVVYRHPHDPEKVWTGRGRRPKWVDEFDVAPSQNG